MPDVKKQQYMSGDFSKVRSRLECVLPEQLIHANVCEPSKIDVGFAKERNHPVHIVNLPSQTMSMTIGELDEKQSTRLHRHNYETILYVIEGEGFTLIEDRKVQWKKGDAVYIPVWAWHQHVNTGELVVKYIACENAPLLQNLGNIALREESE